MSKTVLRLRALMSKWLTFALHSVSLSKNVQRLVPGLQRKSPPWAHKHVPSCSFPTCSHLCARTQKKNTQARRRPLCFCDCDWTTISDGSSRCFSHHPRQQPQRHRRPPGLPHEWHKPLLFSFHCQTWKDPSHSLKQLDFCHVSVVMELFRFIYKAAVVIWQLKNKLEAKQKHVTFLTGRWIEKRLKKKKKFCTLLPSLSVSISSLCLLKVSFILHRWSLIMLSWSS